MSGCGESRSSRPTRDTDQEGVVVRIQHAFEAMGSDCAICIEALTETEAWALAEAGEDEVRRIEARYSRYRADSELTRINRAAAVGGEVIVDTETAALIDYAFACHARSDGAFDVTSGLLRAAWDFKAGRPPAAGEVDALLPRVGLDKVRWAEGRLGFELTGMELDFGGIGKEYAADRAAEVCIALGGRHGFVNLAGDIRVIGPQVDGQAWRIGVRDPRDRDGLVAEVRLTAGALATSGDYEKYIEVDGRRYSHILDPRTGWPAGGLASVTVISDRCLVAGSLATIAMLKGADGAAWLAGLGVRHIVVDDQGRSGGSEALVVRPSC